LIAFITFEALNIIFTACIYKMLIHIFSLNILILANLALYFSLKAIIDNMLIQFASFHFFFAVCALLEESNADLIMIFLFGSLIKFRAVLTFY
jgi:hypothetical protein